MTENVRKVKQAMARLSLEGEQTTPEHLADALGWSLKRVKSVMAAMVETDSLDRPVTDDGNTLASFIPGSHDTEGDAVEREMNGEIHALVGMLPERMQYIITRRFGFDGDRPRTLHDVGLELGITRERVRQLEAEALEHMRHLVVGCDLQAFLGE